MKIKLKDEVIFKEDENEDIVIVNILKEDDTYFKLTGVAKEMFKKLSDGKTYNKVISEIENDYEVSKEKLKEDLDSFIKKLKGHDLIESND